MSIGTIKPLSFPIIKIKGFDPSPVAGKIPYAANSSINPDCIDTPFYNDFWEEQIYRCYNGYITGGLRIPPIYYHFLNFVLIKGVGTDFEYPYFCDLHQQLWQLEEDIRKDASVAGAIFPKKRRAGLTYWGVQLINYGIRFIPNYQAGIGSGLDTYLNTFRQKLYSSYNNTIDEFKLNYLNKSDERFILGYEEKTDYGKEKTVHGNILFRTMLNDYAKLEGEYYNDYISEETGEFGLAKKAFFSVLPALKDGEDIIGKSWIYGTGGRMAKAGRVFEDMWNNADNLRLIKFFIPGERFHAPYVKRIGKKSITPNLDKKYENKKNISLLGCEDIIAAGKSLDKEEAIKKKAKNKTDFIKHRQSYPRTVQDVFTSSGTNHFNSEILYDTLYNITGEEPKWRYYKLKWKKNKEGEIILPLVVETEVISDFFKLNEKQMDYCVQIFKMPKPEYKNLDIGGIDGYNEDKTQTTDSLGCTVVVRRGKMLSNASDDIKGNVPICLYYRRPSRKEIFFEVSLMISVLYNLKNNTMISAESDMVIKYYKENNGKRYLSPRPKSFDAPDGKLMHDYGTKMTSYSKPRMISLVQSAVEDDAHLIVFKTMLEDLLAYDEDNIGTDWDSTDAYGLALMRIVDMKKKSPRLRDDEMKFTSDVISWAPDSNGNIRRNDGTASYLSEVNKLFRPQMKEFS